MPTPSTTLRARAETSPELRALLAGDGPAIASVPGADGPVELERVAAAGGALLVLRGPRDGPRVEHGLRSEVLGRVVAGAAHDIRNPLNAMALRLAILGETLEAAGPAGQTAAGHLPALREQIGRVNEVLRRLVDTTDPAAPLGWLDLAALAADVVSLLGYEARHRRIELTLDTRAGAVRTAADPARVGRLVLCLFGRGLACTPDGGRLAGRVSGRGVQAVIEIDHTAGDPDDDVRYDMGVLASGVAALGGQFDWNRGEQGLERLALAIPGVERP